MVSCGCLLVKNPRKSNTTGDYNHLTEGIQDIVRHVVLQHPPGDQHRVEILVICPDPCKQSIPPLSPLSCPDITLVGDLPSPPAVRGTMVTDDVDDPPGRVERLVD